MDENNDEWYVPDIEESEYLACPYEDLPILLKYVDRTPISSRRWSNFGKEPPSIDVIEEGYSNDPNIRDALGEIDFSPGSPDHEVVLSDFRKRMMEYSESQREEPVVKKWADDKQELANYLKNHIVQCEKCLQRYAQFIVDKSLILEGENIWNDIAREDWVYLNIGTSAPQLFMYFSGALVQRKIIDNLPSKPEEHSDDNDF